MKKILCAIVLAAIFSCKDKTFNPEWTTEQAPATFSARFETSKGNFEITVKREYSPHAADRFYQLVSHGYYDNAVFYRVVPQFVAQFGNTDTLLMNRWREHKIPDEPVKHANKRGTVSFASEGKESRDLEVFINLLDNPVLDTIQTDGVKGFPAFGDVAKGMDVVDKLYSGYADKPMTDPDLYASRSELRRSFPMLDVIRKAYIIESE